MLAKAFEVRTLTSPSHQELPRPALPVAWLAPRERRQFWSKELIKDGSEGANRWIASMPFRCADDIDWHATLANDRMKKYFGWVWAMSADVHAMHYVIPHLVLPKFIKSIDNEVYRED